MFKESLMLKIAFCLKILEPPRVLKWTLRDHEIDTVKSVNAVPKTKDQFQKKKDLEDFPLIKSFLNKVAQNK